MAEASDYIAYLQKIVNLNTIDKMTKDLEEQLQGSWQMMSQIQAMFQTIPNQSEMLMENTDDQEDLYKFLEADVPNLMMPDMENISSDVDLDRVIATIKALAENLKKNICVAESVACSKHAKVELTTLELDQYAASLEQLSKRLVNLKLIKSEEVKNRSPELENKLTQLCLDVNAFTQVGVIYLVTI